MMQKLTIDNLRSLTVAELGLVPAGSQDDSMLVAGALEAEFDDSCAYSNLGHTKSNLSFWSPARIENWNPSL